MKNKNLKTLIKRGIALGDTIKLTQDEIEKVQRKLNISLPKDFKELCANCSYESFYLFGFLNFGSDGGVIGETLYYRKNNALQEHYILLFWDDVSFIVLNTKEDKKSEVIWCDYQDFFNLCDNLPMQYNPTIFPTFADFYEFLLDEEEKMREEEKTLSN